ncbi:hypothetical protein BDZ89DRAFT_1068824, partial [Hymenopellis radicata]
MASPEPPALRMRRRNHQRSRSPCTGMLCASLNLTRPATAESQCPHHPHPHKRSLFQDDSHYAHTPMRRPTRSWEVQTHCAGYRTSEADIASCRNTWVIQEEEDDEWQE